MSNKVCFYYYSKSELFYFERIFYLLMNRLIILKALILYIKNLFYLKGCGTECALYLLTCNLLSSTKSRITTNFLIKTGISGEETMALFCYIT